jgi:hypothetical protein
MRCPAFLRPISIRLQLSAMLAPTANRRVADGAAVGSEQENENDMRRLYRLSSELFLRIFESCEVR